METARNKTGHTRRDALKRFLIGGSAVVTAGSAAIYKLSAFTPPIESLKLKGCINHSLCRWTFGFMSLGKLCQTVKAIGFNALDLVSPEDWPILQRHGIYCAMCKVAGPITIEQGFNRVDLHSMLTKKYEEVLPLMTKAGYKNVICFSGNRNSMDDETGLRNCEIGIKKFLSEVEKRGIVVHMELLNSKIDHLDYMCDKSSWGVELCKRIDSPNFKLLYDIYHMQIDEGDVIRTIRENHQYFGHYHTGGVPGRKEIDEAQELNYPAIIKAILATGFNGFIAQEFIPSAEVEVASLKRALQICDV